MNSPDSCPHNNIRLQVCQDCGSGPYFVKPEVEPTHLTIDRLVKYCDALLARGIKVDTLWLSPELFTEITEDSASMQRVTMSFQIFFGDTAYSAYVYRAVKRSRTHPHFLEIYPRRGLTREDIDAED
jgi:hypothetical protein